jgi:2-polyprenyl-3-methyl-5-hydroxy-6-metoxy-1,4-benzoquinol methylase
LEDELLENHKRYLERNALYRSFGYDVDKERAFILEKAQPLYGAILEAGTGKGHFALALAKAGHSFVSFDISPEEQRFAKLNLAYFSFEKSADFRIENGERTSFSDGSFDTVFSVNVLHHLYNPTLVLDELIRLISPEGKLILADFTEEGFKTMDKIHGLEGKSHEAGKMTLSEARAYLVKKGFSVRTAESVYQRVLVASRDRA